MEIISWILHLGLLSLLWGCNHLFFYPDRHQYVDWSKVPHSFQEFQFTSTDKNQLHGMEFKRGGGPSPLPQSYTLLFHGNAQNLTTHFVQLFWTLTYDHQYFIFDYRGFGKSQGEVQNLGAVFDGKVAIDFAYERFKKSGAKHFIIYGQSLGGVLALKALENHPLKNKVDLLVLDSTFLSYQDQAFSVLSSHWATFLFSPLSYVLVHDKLSPTDFVTQNKIPTLVIHSKADEIVPYKHGEEIFKLLSSKKWFWAPDDPPHTGVFFTKNLKYRKKYLELLKSLPPRTSNTAKKNVF